MSFTESLDLSFSGGIWLALIYLVISTSLTLMLPKYRLSAFIKLPHTGTVGVIYRMLYYLQLLILFFLSFAEAGYLFYTGIGIYFVGILLYSAAMFYFAITEYNKPVTRGIYKFSRHPVYISFFIIILGAAVTTGNLILLIMNVLHLICTFFIIQAEELECRKKYGREYEMYMKKVKRF